MLKWSVVEYDQSHCKEADKGEYMDWNNPTVNMMAQFKIISMRKAGFQLKVYQKKAIIGMVAIANSS